MRITPAGAGKTERINNDYYSWRDHPRRCGENRRLFATYARILGSPPQVRGKLAIRSLNRLSPRITPAGAGKTAASIFTALNFKDHPRRCGENALSWVAIQIFSGITPAGAGKTTRSTSPRMVFWDHPRRCGENGEQDGGQSA